ncbi:TetR/AcrR family transcriptional regulator [Amycolatopsis anabasis]|uniref:TetR/AcrR family transcriptional regulator n=1 Tax=Amycolatopsis anabasis TaxID=1840409 RepID=UPI00131C644E|nr:TetR/AcrR family transcriptional regulator [Amycolatopsis anabasis]
MGNRERLLEAARRLLEDKGYADITARDLVGASKTNLASIGYHFGSKDALLAEAIGAAFTDWCDRFTEIALRTDATTPFDRLVASLVAYADSMAQRRKLSLAFLDAAARAARDEELRELAAGQYQRMREQIAAVAAEFVGEPDPGDPTFSGVASLILALVDGLALQWLLDSANAPTGEQVAAGLRGLLVAAGLATGTGQE